ncbi:serine/threonine protein kinase-transforming protein raf, putative [Entamoeba invadens IP1]|uniref:Serine/threonine protein kinase-transforming protein raf, putative n=1 Tax=Entamoeba invadens IP1 TaxID=370355 RepID=A0A0A1UBG0_ENTIV|nr:serine/threonine protein kinase-transforming protein raf, putative [Entamoeba invadens IP1]ELP89569.1 serine/threonine protein kinase-transforming protein raf, putative [Entamoeba invadens IP1]|eukprot:XP_004256340.1 serine/threonine protein kinase-transforming protein raf, putative [Entamoeba invadens IP1]
MSHDFGKYLYLEKKSQEFEEFVKSSLFISTSDFTLDKEKDYLGAGEFGKVYKIQMKGTSFALKINKNPVCKEYAPGTVSELETLRGSHNNNVVLFVGLTFIDERLGIITEYVDSDLETFIHKRSSPRFVKVFGQLNINLDLKIRIMEQCCLGVQWLHNAFGIIHRDIKPANFLMNTSFEVKICDFGLAVNRKIANKQKKGTLLYMSPEVLKDEEDYGKPADVYSLAITLWELLYEKVPFCEYEKKCEKDTSIFEALVIDNVRPILPHIFLEEYKGKKAFEQMCQKIAENYKEKMNEIPKYLEEILKKAWKDKPTSRSDINKLVEDVSVAKLSNVLNSQSASEWWSKHFGTDKTRTDNFVTSKVFSEALAKTFKYDTYDQKATETAFSPSGSVDILRFKFLISIFGKFYLNKNQFLKMLDIIQAKWYNPALNKATAAGQMEGRVDGTFLIRESTTDPSSPLTLLKMVKGKVSLVRIECTKKGESILYTILTKTEKESSEYLCDLIDKLVTLKVITQPCPKEYKESIY